MADAKPRCVVHFLVALDGRVRSVIRTPIEELQDRKEGPLLIRIILLFVIELAAMRCILRVVVQHDSNDKAEVVALLRVAILSANARLRLRVVCAIVLEKGDAVRVAEPQYTVPVVFIFQTYCRAQAVQVTCSGIL